MPNSLINTLANQNGLARISKTPGRTQRINYFDFGRFLLADLPGYGYAKVSKTVLAHWQKELGRYLLGRQSLLGVIHLMDARHPLQDNDRQMRDYLLSHGVQIVSVLTKIDELRQSDQAKAAKSVLDGTGAGPVMFSSRSGRGKRELLSLLANGPTDDDDDDA